MTSKEYLKDLKKLIKTLPVEEQDEALDYYTQYFDDALAAAEEMSEGKTEDELMEAIIKDLGTPEQLAAEIKDKFASVPATTGKRYDYKKEQRPEGFEEDGEYFKGRRAYAENARVATGPFIVKSAGVQKLELDCNMAEVVIIPAKGNEIIAEGRGPRGFGMKFDLDNGTLRIKNNLKEARMFFRKRTGFPFGMNTPRILVELPENLRLESFVIEMSAGAIRAENLSVTTGRFGVAINAGDVKVQGVTSDKTKIDCNAGSVSVKGTFRGKTLLDCNAGSITFETTGSVRDYSLTEDINMGSVTVNGEKHKAFADDYTSGEKANDILADVNCGKIDITIG